MSEEKRQQVLALGRLGWPLRRIQHETGVRRETASAYLKAAGIAIRPPGGWGKRPPESKPANQVSPDFGGDSAKSDVVDPVPIPAQDPTLVAHSSLGPSVTSSACEAYRDFIELSLSKGRNAKAIYQDLVEDHGFTGRYASVKRFVRHCRGSQAPEARAVILRPARNRRSTTAPARWCAIRFAADTAARACSCSRSDTAASAFDC